MSGVVLLVPSPTVNVRMRGYKFAAASSAVMLGTPALERGVNCMLDCYDSEE
jgi:hypothetical protein